MENSIKRKSIITRIRVALQNLKLGEVIGQFGAANEIESEEDVKLPKECIEALNRVDNEGEKTNQSKKPIDFVKASQRINQKKGRKGLKDIQVKNSKQSIAPIVNFEEEKEKIESQKNSRERA